MLTRGVRRKLGPEPALGRSARSVALSPEAEDDLAREDDLDFLAEVRTANLRRLCQLKVNLGYGGPRWMRMAVERAIAHACPATGKRAAA